MNSFYTYFLYLGFFFLSGAVVAQNVGIGQASPSAKLDVRGSLLLGAGAAYSGSAVPPLNGAIIQGHTLIGVNTPLFTEDVLEVVALGGDYAVNGYVNAGIGTAGYFRNIGTGASLEAIINNATNASYVLALETNGLGQAGVLSLTNSLNTQVGLSLAHAGNTTGIGQYIHMSAIGNTGAALLVDYLGNGNALDLNLNTSANTATGIRIDNAGAGRAFEINITNPANAFRNFVMNNAGTATPVDINQTNATATSPLATFDNASAGIGLRINQTNLSNTYGLQINQSGTNFASHGLEVNVTNVAGTSDAGRFLHAGTGTGVFASVVSGNAVIGHQTIGAPYGLFFSGLNGHNSAFANGGAGGAFGGISHGIIAGSQEDNNVNTDHDGGSFMVYDNMGVAVAYASVASIVDNTIYKILGFGVVSTVVKDTQEELRIMAAPESPEVLFQDFGRGTLINGSAHIEIDPILSNNIIVDETHPLEVFIQLKGDCKGVFVTRENAMGFDVIELQGGQSNVPFSWFISANRKDENVGGRHIQYQDNRFKPVKFTGDSYVPTHSDEKPSSISSTKDTDVSQDILAPASPTISPKRK